MTQDLFIADVNLIRALEKRSQPICCSEGHILFSQGEVAAGLYILQSGEAGLIMQSDTGNIVMCIRAFAGSLLGLPAVVGNEPYTLSAVIRKGSEVRFVTRKDFEELMQAEPSLYPMVLEILAAELRSARRALSEI